MRLRRRPALLALAVVIVLALAALVVPGHLGRSAREGGGAAAPGTLALGAPHGPAVTIGRHPIGLSIEYPLLAQDLGGGACPSTALVRTLRALGSPTIRIGGGSQDAVAPAGTPAQPGVTDLPRDFWSRVACLERETQSPVVVGLNLASGETAWAAALAASARAAIPAARLSFELGNEPDIYGAPVPWWNGHALLGTHMPWPIYLKRARAVAAVLGPGSVLEGPDFASGRWVRQVPMLATTLHLRTLDAHFYPLDACRDPTEATVASLLSRQVQIKLDERVRLVRYARALRLAAVVSEANSVSCGGVAGISDGPAAAVWAVRLVLQALRDGFAAVRFHSSGGAYDPFVVNAGVVTPRPLYLGLLSAAGLLSEGAVLRAIPNAAALDALAITRADGAKTFVLSNYAAAPRWISFAAPAGEHVSVLGIVASAPAVRRGVVVAVRGRLRVELPPNSVDAIALPPAAAAAGAAQRAQPGPST
jgi:hypothetical protein